MHDIFSATSTDILKQLFPFPDAAPPREVRTLISLFYSSLRGRLFYPESRRPSGRRQTPATQQREFHGTESDLES